MKMLSIIFSLKMISGTLPFPEHTAPERAVLSHTKKKHPDKKFLHLSLAHFQALDDGSLEENDSEDNTKMTAQEDAENIIEGKILNQLIQQIPAEKIPQTNFRIKKSIDWKEPTFISAILCLFIALFLYCTKFEECER
jgi:hypothetical protein